MFTTRPDTSFGMTYAVLAPEHPLVAEITGAEQREQVQAFVEQAAGAEDIERMAEGGALEKRGVFTGAYLLNPFNKLAVPLYIADYVLMTYGTGAIMAVPGQDQRDWDFARAHGLPIVRTVQPPEDFPDEPYLGEGPAINSEWLNGLEVAEAKEKAIQLAGGRGHRAAQGQLPAARLGRFPPALLGLPDSHDLLRGMRRSPGSRAVAAGGVAGRRAVYGGAVTHQG